MKIKPEDYTAEEVNVIAAKFNLRNKGTKGVPLWMVELFCESLTVADKAIKHIRKLQREKYK